ncbi:hypothetical protein CIB84_011654 [Bambusicola thoracicus]|uniref:Uncharacterized protein n=1 Tax=Bambusicola thoracicus TaxID=9083 RepID=A0A2P4SKF3_BAMTH|nr:hypothetical protein CIB84_011654 [Bambusicola thoracicus]
MASKPLRWWHRSISMWNVGPQHGLAAPGLHSSGEMLEEVIREGLRILPGGGAEGLNLPMQTDLLPSQPPLAPQDAKDPPQAHSFMQEELMLQEMIWQLLCFGVFI